MHDNSAIEGMSFSGAVATFSPEMMQVLADVNRWINGFVGVCILIVVILIFLHGIRWAIMGSNSPSGRSSIAGALRAFIALFLMVDIWALIRLVQRVMDIAPSVAYVVLIFGVVLLFAWSLFGIGNLVIDTLLASVHYFEDRSIRMIRGIHHTSRFVRYVQSKKDPVLRFFILLVMATGVSLLALYWQFTGFDVKKSKPMLMQNTYSTSEDATAEPLSHEEYDAVIASTTYTNSRYGISITYPDGWNLYSATDTNVLMAASNENKTMYAQLNAGSYKDMPGSTHQDNMNAFWRIEKNVHLNFAKQSAGILQSNIYTAMDIANASSSRIDMVAFWPYPDGSYGPGFDDYLVFGHGPMYYTLQVSYRNSASQEEVDAAIKDVFSSIRLTK